MFEFQAGRNIPDLIFDHDANEDEQLLSPAAEEAQMKQQAEKIASPKCNGPSGHN